GSQTSGTHSWPLPFQPTEPSACDINRLESGQMGNPWAAHRARQIHLQETGRAHRRSRTARGAFAPLLPHRRTNGEKHLTAATISFDAQHSIIRQFLNEIANDVGMTMRDA